MSSVLIKKIIDLLKTYDLINDNFYEPSLDVLELYLYYVIKVDYYHRTAAGLLAGWLATPTKYGSSIRSKHTK